MKNVPQKPYSFSINDTTLPSDNPLSHRKKSTVIDIKWTITIDDPIKDEKPQIILIKKQQSF